MEKQILKFGHKKLYIDGELYEASNGAKFEVICPADEKPTATIAWASKTDTQHALESAERGFREWAKMPFETRLQWIDKLRDQIIGHRDLLQESIMYEMGKTWESSDEDLTSIINSLKYYADEIQNRKPIPIDDLDGTHEHKLMEQPLGVAVAFLAYNFPLLNLGFKLGPALAAGSSIILKPSEFSPLSAYIIGELCAEINFPKGVITVICGDVQDVGIPLCESIIPRLITMIGSTETAQKLIVQSAKTSIKRYSMECGGNAPFIVFDDADLELAINIGAGLKTGNSGQICVAANRYYIHEEIIDDFIRGIKKKFDNAKVGFGRENNPDMGPLANAQSVAKVHAIVEEAINQGGELISGGKPIDRPGYYFEPTAIRLEDNTSEILQQEIFGPVALITSFSTKEEAIGLANSVDVGLASYVFSQSKEILDFFTENLEFGEVQLNGVKYDIYLPHFGVKNSGIGMDCSPYALNDYLVKKRVTLALE